MEVISYLVENHIVRLKNNNPEFLLLKRVATDSYPNIWQMVTGSIYKDEKAVQTAIRELFEETSLTPEKLWIVPNVNSFYEPTKDVICLVPVFVSLVKISDEVVISNEHSEFRWVNKDEAIKLLAWNGQRKSVEIIFEYFSNINSTYKFIEVELK